jgi:hypothetical protein
MAEPTHEIWARAAWAAIQLSERAGLPRAELFRGLPWDATSVRALKKVKWDDYATLIENIGALAGDGLEDLLEASYHDVFPELRKAFGLLVDSKPLVRFVVTIANPLLFTPVMFELEDLGGRHVRITARLRPGARACEPFFRGSIGAWRGIPRHLDMPPAQVTAKISGTEGIYDLLLPPDRTAVARMKSEARSRLDSLVQMVLGREPDGTEVHISFDDGSAD